MSCRDAAEKRERYRISFAIDVEQDGPLGPNPLHLTAPQLSNYEHERRKKGRRRRRIPRDSQLA